jgi:hypothetical protein
MIIGVARSNDHQVRGCWSVTNGIRDDPRGFTGAYRSGTWVRPHDAWVLREGHGMVRMPVLDVRTWPRGDIPGLGLTDEDVGLLRGVDCDILAQGLIGLIEYSYHQGIPFFRKLACKELQGAWPRAILGWVTDRKVFSGVHKSGQKCVEKTRVGLWGLVYNPRGFQE